MADRVFHVVVLTILWLLCLAAVSLAVSTVYDTIFYSIRSRERSNYYHQKWKEQIQHDTGTQAR